MFQHNAIELTIVSTWCRFGWEWRL